MQLRSGFMALVEKSKQGDSLLSSVSEAYDKWIG
jgi:hypothetical protein